ncbi:pyridoxal phosphate-dependent transferase [Syncephalis pseudoplumigaleata]|uniref:Pyridoxal phosphate-dependent transferase n=1 Tax=Syncephalis pseudoplumigaleata TaxID=1712513 RepID=A0A4P9YT81_9FUNG|nr:pyridoxal phosphate-dependent transferase [Syncephalis pseudoplumigaleata]|eukprot:RKP22622.1 pyridoxal phosphate-dependent transferase [Syncephalis pseudoplumigaleata]
MTMNTPISKQVPTGTTLPDNNMHAIVVSIPSWKAGIDYREGVPEVCDKLRLGYPRFMYNERVMQLGRECLKRLHLDVARYGCLPMQTREAARQCRDHLNKHNKQKHEHEHEHTHPDSDSIVVDTVTIGQYAVHVIAYPIEHDKTAKHFWEMVGCGITSRFAHRCLNEVGIAMPNVLLKHNISPEAATRQTLPADCLPEDQVDKAKQLIKQRLVSVIQRTYADAEDAGAEFTQQHPSALALNEDNAYLYPCGMNAIYNLHRLLGFMKTKRKTVCYGFPYLCAHKILDKVGSGSIFYGHGSEEELDDLEKRLADPAQERILSIFCEFPSNPLLKAPNIRRLRALADQHDIPLLIDGTVGGFSNCLLFPYADVMIVSLTKLFSGSSDVMGGCLVVNTTRSHGARLQHALNVDGGDGRPGYEDTTWWEDMLVLERHSRTFTEREARINKTAETICDYLRAHPKVAAVYYPKYTSDGAYDSYKRQGGGYGCLFSLTFHTPQAAIAFFDALLCPKGTSFGTVYTLAVPYTILAHYTEQEWALQYDVPLYLIRVTVGLEDVEAIRTMFDVALAAIPDEDVETIRAKFDLTLSAIADEDASRQ